MTRIKIDSSNIDSVNYDETTNTLQIWFKYNKDKFSYVYENIVPNEYAEFILATSQGEYFDKFIRYGKLVKKIAEPVENQSKKEEKQTKLNIYSHKNNR